MRLQPLEKNQLLYILCFVAAVLVSVLIFPEGVIGVIFAAAISCLVFYLLRRHEDSIFLRRTYLIGLLARGTFAAAIFYFNAYAFFGGDAQTYDYKARLMLDVLSGAPVDNYTASTALSMQGSGWGMPWFVALIYFLTGNNLFAVMMVECAVGAATALLVYHLVVDIYSNRRAARIAALLITLFPAMIIWSAQALKDGLIVFLLVLLMLCVVRLQKSYNIPYTALLILCLFGILALRFYIFYMAAIAVTGSFAVGASQSVRETINRIVLFAVIGTVLLYVGAIRSAGTDFEKYGNLEAIQRSRDDLANSADSGFNKDTDVSTTEGLITAVPIGFAYLMLAPFPWTAGSLRQALVIPENLLWWCLLPFLGIGLWYTIKNRWRDSIAILIFTFMLTFAYSIFQGNVGTAYRQRTQIQVFLFIFIAVGWVLQKEKAENKQLRRR